MPTYRQWAAAQTAELQAVDRQRNYLRNPLPAGPGICRVCRSSTDERFPRCYQCEQHQTAGRDRLADVVVPIAYAIKGDQHAHALAVYKATPPSAMAIRNLSSLAIMHLGHHWDCLTQAVGGPFTHITSVPSTRARPGVHPINNVITRRISLPTINITANPNHPPDERQFHPDRFLVSDNLDGARVLLVDDTWTTGSRIQSLAHALKTAGAGKVGAVVLGRHINPNYSPSKPLVAELRRAPWFDIRKCALDQSAHA